MSGSYSFTKGNVCESAEVFPEDHTDPYRAT